MNEGDKIAALPSFLPTPDRAKGGRAFQTSTGGEHRKSLTSVRKAESVPVKDG